MLWGLWLLSAVWVIRTVDAVMKYVKTKQGKNLAKACLYGVGAALLIGIGEYNRGVRVREAEHALRDRTFEAKNKLMRLELKPHTPEEATAAVLTFVSDLRADTLAQSLSTASEEYRAAWREYVQRCAEAADELKGLGTTAPSTLWWLNDDEAAAPENISDKLRQRILAVQNADKALKNLESRNRLW